MEQQDLVMLTQRLKPGTLYRVKGEHTSWKYVLITHQSDNKKEIKALSPKRNIVKMTIEDMRWLIKKININFEIVQCL